MSLSLPSATRCCPPAPARPGLFRRLRACLAVRTSRKQLAVLDARLLDDVGLASEAARAEAQRPLWDVPAHWLK